MKKMVMVLMVVMACMLLTQCTAMDWVKKDSNATALLGAAQPYLLDGCKEVKIAPMYTINVVDGITKLTHSGGFLVGGCGSLVELKCTISGEAVDDEGPCKSLMKWVLDDMEVATASRWIDSRDWLR